MSLMSILGTSRRAARSARVLAVAALTALGAAGCNDFLAGGELDTDPNRPTAANNQQLFVGITSNTWALLGSDPARVTGLWMQQFDGIQSQYISTYRYTVNEATTNGFNSALYAGGGLKDVRLLQSNARAQSDTLFLGIAQIQEALLMGTGADLFGDLVYTEALKGTPNPKLDKQLVVYDSVQSLLTQGINNLTPFVGRTANGPTNLGPRTADISYLGNPGKWIRLAHTLKARFYLHTAEVRPAAYAQALAEARLGITDPANDYLAKFSGASSLESNFWYQFTQEQRFGYLVPNESFVALMQEREDPRLEQYFDVTGDVCGEPFFCLAYEGSGALRGDEAFPQPLVTAQENYLIWAETAQRAGNDAEAREALNSELAIAGLDPVAGTLAGPALLRAILTEKYIALFQSLEVWNDYKRTCFPNVAPTVEGLKMPGRFLYDAAERQTNSSIPGAQAQPTRNENDPRTATDPFGNACLAQ